VYADAGSQRHDPSHLLTHRLSAPLAAVAAALESDVRSGQAHLSPDSISGAGSLVGGLQHMPTGRHGPGAVGQQQLKVRHCIQHSMSLLGAFVMWLPA
jgi:hypothetical protein